MNQRPKCNLFIWLFDLWLFDSWDSQKVEKSHMFRYILLMNCMAKLPPYSQSCFFQRDKEASFCNAHNKVFLFFLRLGLSMLCSHNSKMCLGRHLIFWDRMVHDIHLQHSGLNMQSYHICIENTISLECRKRLRPFHSRILPGQSCQNLPEQ